MGNNTSMRWKLYQQLHIHSGKTNQQQVEQYMQISDKFISNLNNNDAYHKKSFNSLIISTVMTLITMWLLLQCDSKWHGTKWSTEISEVGGSCTKFQMDPGSR